MKNKQDGRGKAEYVQDTEENIRRLGRGGEGLHESLRDAQERGVTDAQPTEAPPRIGGAKAGAAPPRSGGKHRSRDGRPGSG
jgi:hypothetical protein